MGFRVQDTETWFVMGVFDMQEFAPWWKWMMFDALLKLVARFLARRFPRFESIFEAVGWI